MTSEERNKYMKEYHEKNKEKHKELCKEYYQKNKEKHKLKAKEYRENNKEKILEIRKEYNKNNKEKISEKQKEWRENNKEYRKEYRETNKEKISEKQKEWRENNKKRFNEYMRNKRRTDESFRIAGLCRARVKEALKGKMKSMKTQELIGCSWKELAEYLENTKVIGKDYTDKHIDHIIPCASFDLTEPDQLKRCFHYTNLQYLPAIENLKKSASVPNETLRMPLVPPESEVLFDGSTKSEQTESRPIRRAIENSSRESSLDDGDAPEPDFVPFGPHSPDDSS